MDTANVRKLLVDNGASPADLQFVFNTTAGAKMRSLAAVNKVNESGSDDMLRRGVLLDVHGMALRESAQIKNVTKGTGASYVTSGVSAVGATTVVLATGTGTVNPGDVVTFAADTVNKYVVASGVSAPGTITLAAPGLLVSIPTGNAMTVGGNFAANMGFSRDAIQIITRAPAMPEGGDSADDITEIMDPLSGLAFQVAMYKQYRQVKFEVGLAWGVKVTKPAHIALLIGQ